MEINIVRHRIKFRRKYIYRGVIYQEGSFTLVVPPEENPQRVYDDYREWIENTAAKADKRSHKLTALQQRVQNLNLLPVKRTPEEFQQKVIQLVKEYAEQLEVVITSVSFRSMRSRWGSCTDKCRLSFRSEAHNLPDRVLEYLVYHEVCHCLHLNHGAKFWKQVAQQFPDYLEVRQILQHWDEVAKGLETPPSPPTPEFLFDLQPFSAIPHTK